MKIASLGHSGCRTIAVDALVGDGQRHGLLRCGVLAGCAARHPELVAQQRLHLRRHPPADVTVQACDLAHERAGDTLKPRIRRQEDGVRCGLSTRFMPASWAS